MRISKKWGIPVAAVAVVLLSVSCSSKSSSGPDDNGGDDEIKTGTAITYQVSGGAATSVKDSVSGVTFEFPKGGNGTLSVAPVLSGPEVGVSATRIAVEYTGSGEVAISVPHTMGYEEILYIRGKIPNVSVQGAQSGDEAWLGVPPSENRSDATVFTISSSAGKGSGKRTLSGEERDLVAIATLKLTSEEMARRTEAIRLVNEAVNYWVRNLPQSLADSARTKINGDLKCSITWSSDGNYYDHDNRTIYLQVDGDPDARANTHTCAHEVGHYMTHVLAGYDRYKDMLNRMPCNWYGAILAHGFADYFEYRKYVVEEYAFLSDYLITGTVDGTNITSPSIATMFGSSGPEVKDFPSFEGYGVIMLGSLLRTNSRVNSFWYKTNGVSQAPVVGAPIGDVLALTVRGARDTNEMYTVIQDYLTSRGYTDRYKLPAMLEPLGWSYHGSGKVIDTNGSPVQNATVQSLTQNGSGEFRTPASSPTGTDGAFSLSRIFSGTNLIRVFYNSGKDSTTFQVTADSTKTTNAAINLGTIKVGKEAATKKFSFSIVSKLYDIANFKIDVTYEITGYGFESNAKNPEYALDIPIGQPVSVKATGTVTVEPLKLRNGDDNSYEEYSFGAPKVVFRSVTYSGIAVTETKNANPYTGSFTFSGAGQLLYFEAPVTVPYTKTVYTKGVGSYDTKGYLSYYGGACYLYSK